MISRLKIILVDDDKDDHFIFEKTLKELPIPSDVVCINDGEKLMEHLSENINQLPDAIFLDLNMPRKNGSECLTEIKLNKKLKNIPVIIYSTSFHNDILDLLHKHGAYYCIRKSTDPVSTKKNLMMALKSIIDRKEHQPSREKFAPGVIDK
jgi:CheY-like chemotaxis protein